MQSIPVGRTKPNYPFQPDRKNDLYHLVIEKNKAVDLINFLCTHPETLGLEAKEEKICFNEELFRTEVGKFNKDTYQKLNQKAFDFTLHSTKFSKEFKSIINCLIIDGHWKLVSTILTSLSPEKIESLKELSPKVHYGWLREMEPDLVISMIMTFPKINWKTLLEANSNYRLSAFENHPTKELVVYPHVIGLHSKEGNECLSKLFEPIYEVFYKTCLKNLDLKPKKSIAKDIILSTYPILASAPEVFNLFDSFCRVSETNLKKKTAHLAFREYRQRNGLCMKKFTYDQKKDITEMFIDCFSEKPIYFDAPARKIFIDAIGKDQEVKKPLLKKGMIEKAIDLIFTSAH